MRPSQFELPEIWSTTARPDRTTAAAPANARSRAFSIAPTTPWVREAAKFLGTVAGGLTLLLGAVGLFFPSLLFA